MSKARRRATDKLLAEWFWTDAWTGSRGFSLPMEPRGLYREMLTQAWRREARLPNNHEEIRRITGCSEKEWKRCWPKIAQFWIEDGRDASHLVNATQVVVYLDAKEAAEKAHLKSKAGGEARAQAERERRSSTSVGTSLSSSLSTAQALPSVSVSDQLSVKNTESVVPARTSSGAMAGELPRDHLRHAVCGRMCLHEKQFAEFVVKLGWELDLAKVEVRRWATSVLREWGEGAKRNTVIQGDTFKWWNARYEEWQGSPKAAEQPRGGSLTARKDWSCHHVPPCPAGTTAFRCDQRTQLEAGRQAAEKAQQDVRV